MATGPNWGDPLAPNAQGLWNLRFKFNSDQASFNLKLHLAERTEAQARAIGIDLATRLKALLPIQSEIFDAKVSKDNKKKDARYLATAIGPGTFVPTVVGESKYDFAKTALLCRFEHTDGGSVQLKFPMIPDEKILGGELVTAITAVTSTPVALPALPGGGDAWELSFLNLLKAICFQCHAVKSNYTPGEQYTYYAFDAAYPIRITSKKGGRVFSV